MSMSPPSGSSRRSFFPVFLACLPGCFLSGSPAGVLGADVDCNRNGRPDLDDLQSGASPDCNRNGNPDECDILPVNLGLAVSSQVEVLALTSVDISDLDGDGIADLTGTFLQQPQVSFHWGEGGGRFGPVVRTATGSHSHFIASEDLDEDGDLDLITAGTQDVSVLENHGARQFALAQSLKLGATPRNVVTGDLDGDGDLDLAADQAFAVIVFLQGAERFAEGRSLRVGSDPAAVSIGDLDADGDLDLATANSLDNLSLFLNHGDATFDPPVNLAAGNQPNWIVAEDFDGDGDVDLAVSDAAAVSFFSNRGRGAFDPGEVHVLVSPRNLKPADLDGDGDLDFLAGQESSLTSLWNHGNGQFARGEHEPLLFDRGLPATGDLDGDGDLEVAARSHKRSEVLFLEIVNEPYSDDCNADRVPDDCQPDCNGNGVADDCDTRASTSSDCNANRIPDECEADCDRSGTPDDCDLASGAAQDCNANGIPDSCDVSGQIRFARSQDFDRLADRPQDLVFADVDGDLDLDLALAGPDAVTFFENRGSTLTAGRRVETNTFTHQIQGLDLEMDGDVDFILNGSNRIVALANDGTGSFSRRELFSFFGRSASALPADLDRDGDSDLAVLLDFAPLLILENDGGAFAEGATYLPGGIPNSFVSTHIDADDATDLAVLHDQGLSLFRGRGDGSFDPPREVPVAPLAHGLLAADLDQDGDADLAAAPGAEPAILILLNDGAGAFTTALRSFRDGFRSLALRVAGDLDLDGDVDFVDPGSFAFPISVLINDGKADFKHFAVEELDMDRVDTSVATGDLDGDGDLDLAAGGTLSCLHCLVTDPGLLRIEKNESLPPRSADANHDGIPDECGRAIFHRGDPDGDGRIDISDPVFVLNALFLGGPAVACVESADADNDGTLNLTDPVYVLRYLFLGGPEPVAPGPVSLPCGPDPDPPGSPGDLGCAAYAGCG